MFFILLGIAGFVGVIWLGVELNWNEKFATLLAVLVLVAGVVVGLFVPIVGYEETTETVELVSLNDGLASSGGTTGIWYVSIEADNHYTYYTEVDSKYAEGNAKAYKSYVVSGNVTVIEDDSYTDAKLVTYTKKPKMTFWSFAFWFDEVEYVFYVPTGTVVRNISVG